MDSSSHLFSVLLARGLVVVLVLFSACLSKLVCNYSCALVQVNKVSSGNRTLGASVSI